jgi:hypothetical protein
LQFTYTRVKKYWAFFVFHEIFEKLLTTKTVARPGSMKDEEGRIKMQQRLEEIRR